MYPAIFEEMVTSEIVKPTDCAFVSQKETSRPHFCDLGKYAIQAEATVQTMFAKVDVKSREFGTYSVTAPPISRATTCTPLPTELSSVVFVVGNPRSFIIMVENELITPLGMAAAKILTKTSHILGSLNASKAWSLRNTLFLMPVSLPATRLTAIKRSRSLRNLALEGESGRRNHSTSDHRHVVPPRMKKMSSYRSGFKSAGRVEMPIEMYEPMMPPIPRAQYQIHYRSGISALVYQKPVMSVSPGVL